VNLAQLNEEETLDLQSSNLGVKIGMGTIVLHYCTFTVYSFTSPITKGHNIVTQVLVIKYVYSNTYIYRGLT